MRLELNKHWKNIVSEFPENGMGYSNVVITYNSNESCWILSNAVVINNSYLDISTESISNENIISIVPCDAITYKTEEDEEDE